MGRGPFGGADGASAATHAASLLQHARYSSETGDDDTVVNSKHLDKVPSSAFSLFKLSHTSTI